MRIFVCASMFAMQMIASMLTQRIMKKDEERKTKRNEKEAIISMVIIICYFNKTVLFISNYEGKNPLKL